MSTFGGPIVVDLSVARRAEGALVADIAAFVAGLAEANPAGGACRIPVGQGWAAYTGAGLFGCRVQGAGLTGPLTAAEVSDAEAFYATVGRPTEFELCPLADPSAPQQLADRGYRLVSFRNVYLAEPAPAEARASGGDAIEIGVVDETSFESWSGIVLDGFGYRDQAARDRVAHWNRMLWTRPEARLFLARLAGVPVGAANLLVHGDVASLGGTTTLPAYRRRGVQRALLTARLDHAHQQGCRLAVVTADPGGGSARNVERAGFRLAYTNARLRR